VLPVTGGLSNALEIAELEIAETDMVISKKRIFVIVSPIHRAGCFSRYANSLHSAYSLSGW
jgi:hypothetical protein